MKNVEEIYEEMLAAMERRCGFRPEASCDLAVRLYAAAAQIQALDIQSAWVLDQSFPQTAQGEYLDYHASVRGLQRTEATKAQGMLRFFVNKAAALDFSIPAGTVCMTAEGERFSTKDAAVLAAGATFVDVAAEAVNAGRGANVAKETICILTACPKGITGCSNPAAFSGGNDAESDESLRQRVLDSYRRLPNGANGAWYEKTAMNHEGVAEAMAIGRARGIGTVDVYIATQSGIPDAKLLEEVRKDLQEKREIAVDVQVLAPTTAQVSVAVQIETAAEADFETVSRRVEQVLAEFFGGHLLGKSVRTAELTSLLFGQEGVENLRLLQPSTDIAATQGVLPVLSSVTVSRWGA